MLAVFIAFMGAASPARANFFSDNEARRAILDLRQRYLALSEENGKLRESLQTTQTQLEALRSDVTRVRNREEQLTRDVADLQRRLNQATTEDKTSSSAAGSILPVQPVQQQKRPHAPKTAAAKKPPLTPR